MRIIFIGMLSAVAMGMEGKPKPKPDIKPLEKAEFQTKGWAELNRELESWAESERSKAGGQKDRVIAERDADIRKLKKEITEKEADRKAAEQKTAKLTSEMDDFCDELDLKKRLRTQFVCGGKYATIGEGRKVVTSKKSKHKRKCTARTGWIELPTASPVRTTMVVTTKDGFELGVVASGYRAWDNFMGSNPCPRRFGTLTESETDAYKKYLTRNRIAQAFARQRAKGWSYESWPSSYGIPGRLMSMGYPVSDKKRGFRDLSELKSGQEITIQVQGRTVSWIHNNGFILASTDLPERLDHIAFGVSFKTGSATIVS